MDNNEKDLLVISSGFPDKSGTYLAHTFVKGYVDEAKEYFKRVIILVLLPSAPAPLRKFIGKYPHKLKSYTYDNVEVIYKFYPFIPVWPFKNLKAKIAFFLHHSKVYKLIDGDTIVHANFTNTAGIFAYNLKKKYQLNYLLTVHEDHDWLTEEVNSNNTDFINTWKNATSIIRVNKLDNVLLEKYNKNVVTIPNGFNHRKFKPLDSVECRTKLRTPKDKKVIVNIGFYNNQKNQKLLIKAISLLEETIKNKLTCYIIGGGPKAGELEVYIKEKNLENIVVLVGQVEHDRLPIYLNAADIFCLSSNSEGNPTVMFEALGVGIPYVGTNVGGIPEIITSDNYGLLCNPNDEKALSKIIEEGLTKMWDRDEILEFANQFSWKHIFLTTKKYY